MKKLYWVFVSVLSFTAAVFSGCGDDFDNVQACKDWVTTVSCGMTDFNQYVNCDSYAETTCDISGYFDCLTANTTCDQMTGMADVTQWSTCANKAVCE